MKKLFVVIFCITCNYTFAQMSTSQRTISAASSSKVRLNAYSNYIFSDAVDSYFDANNYYNGKVNDGFQWGAGIEFMVHPQYGIEISYLHESTTAALKNFKYPSKFHDYNLGMNYYFLSGTRYFSNPGGKVEGFAGMGLGVGSFNAKDPADGRTSNLTKFSWQFRGGAIIWATNAVGIRLQAQLQSAVQAIGGGLYLGTGGVGVGASTYSSIMQFGLGGGLVFKMGGKR